MALLLQWEGIVADACGVTWFRQRQGRGPRGGDLAALDGSLVQNDRSLDVTDVADAGARARWETIDCNNRHTCNCKRLIKYQVEEDDFCCCWLIMSLGERKNNRQDFDIHSLPLKIQIRTRRALRGRMWQCTSSVSSREPESRVKAKKSHVACL